VVAGGKLWFTGGCSGFDGSLASMNMNGSGVTVAPPDSDWSYCPEIEHTSSAPDLLFMHSTGLSPGSLTEFDVSGGSAEWVNRQDFGWGPYSDADVAASPDGLNVLVPGDWGGTFGLGAFQTSDLSGPSEVFTNAASYSGSPATTQAYGGLIAAVGTDKVQDDIDVSLWQVGNTTPIRTMPLESDDTVYRNGIAFTPDGGRIFVITKRYLSPVVLHVLSGNPTNLSLTGKMLGKYTTVGQTADYNYSSRCAKRGRGCPGYVATLTPDHAGECLVFELQVMHHTDWYKIPGFGPKCAKMRHGTGDSSTAGVVIRYSSPAVEGYLFRIFASFKGDSADGPIAASGSQFKVR
jgi:hypothetical protein